MTDVVKTYSRCPCRARSKGRASGDFASSAVAIITAEPAAGRCFLFRFRFSTSPVTSSTVYTESCKSYIELQIKDFGYIPVQY